VGLIGRKPTLLVVALLCIVQFVWACFSERATLGATGIVAALLSVLVCLGGFEAMRSLGLRRERKRKGVAGARDSFPVGELVSGS